MDLVWECLSTDLYGQSTNPYVPPASLSLALPVKHAIARDMQIEVALKTSRYSLLSLRMGAIGRSLLCIVSSPACQHNAALRKIDAEDRCGG